MPSDETRRILKIFGVAGTDETDSVCRDIKAAHVRIASVGRGHHFSGEYGQLVDGPSASARREGPYS
jgi:type IV secretory pathway VirJ component